MRTKSKKLYEKRNLKIRNNLIEVISEDIKDLQMQIDIMQRRCAVLQQGVEFLNGVSN